MKKFIISTIAVLGLSSTAYAGWFDPPEPTSDKEAAQKLETLLKEAQRQVGIPSIVNFFEARMVRQLYELRDDPEFRTYSYIVTLNGDFIKICDSVGFGINASIQIANPEKVTDAGTWRENGWMTIPQAEPNGLFMPEGLAATYVMCVDGEEIKPVYVEPEVIVSPFALGK